MYCPRCGAQVADGSAFCASCGTNLAQPSPVYPAPQPYGTPYNPVFYQQKSGGLAAVLALLIPGAGHLYAGKIGRGILIMVAFFGIAFLMPVAGWFWVLSTGSPFDLLWATVIIGLVLFVIWVFQIVDAYNTVKRYNEALMATGRAPW